jgi:transglutaminase-like putative cysteine protease
MVIVDQVGFATKEEKAEYMSREAIKDARLPRVQSWAKTFLRLSPAERAPAILQFVQYGIDYVRDPGEEVLENADVVLERGYGDCDAKERLFVALCNAVGIPAKGHPVFRGERFPHILADVWVGNQWTPADPTIQNSSIGHIPPARAALTNAWSGMGDR